MFYLVHYDRAQSKVLSFKEFPDSERQQALTMRFELEKNKIILIQAKRLSCYRQLTARNYTRHTPSTDTLKQTAKSYLQQLRLGL